MKILWTKNVSFPPKTLTNIFTDFAPDAVAKLTGIVQSGNSQENPELSNLIHQYPFLRGPETRRDIVDTYAAWKLNKPIVACVIDRSISARQALPKLTTALSKIGTCLDLESEGLGRTPDLQIINFLRHMGPTTFLTGDKRLLIKIQFAGSQKRLPQTPHPIYMTAKQREHIPQIIEGNMGKIRRFAQEAQNSNYFKELEL